MTAVKKLAILEKEGQPLQLVLKGKVFLEERTIIYDFTEAETTVVKPRGRASKKKR